MCVVQSINKLSVILLEIELCIKYIGKQYRSPCVSGENMNKDNVNGSFLVGWEEIFLICHLVINRVSFPSVKVTSLGSALGQGFA